MDDHTPVPAEGDRPAGAAGIPLPDIASAAPAPALPAPRIRWAAVVWGVVLAALAATAVWVVTDSARRDDVAEWLLSLSVAAGIAYAILAVGALVLIAGLVGIARRLQRAGEA